ncbi:Transposase DDE domain protein [Botrimarina colliarenosi]|uniref:Transposase DDE domain protein n=2 Tax=Botrimarina colliarenosi TaxID=2528001 RepID=A0A5C6AJ33_9BACT|nr:Transposase DDE domain protein [Botrimarina colliarenosi]
MLFIGYFEAIDSQRGIAWRCADSLSLREFLGVKLTERTPDHSTLSKTRDRLPIEVHELAFRLVLAAAAERGLLKGKTLGVDSTTLEADAAMRSIVRKGSGEDWKAYVKRLMQEAGQIEEGDEPSDEDLRRFDKRRKNKKVSNTEWESPTDPDARTAKLKNGRTRLAYKAEHALDLETEPIVAAEVYHADHSDSQTLADTAMAARTHLAEAGHEEVFREVVADKGYHAAGQLELAQSLGLRTYVPEPNRRHRLRWNNKPIELKEAIYANRRRTKTEKNSKLQRLRSERVERSFAHVCDTGGARRTRLRGIEKVRKRTLIVAAAHNLAILMRRLLGAGKPKALAAILDQLALALPLLIRLIETRKSTGC